MRKRQLPTVFIIIALMLLLSAIPASADSDRSDSVHIVRRGETLYSIARRYGVNMWTLARTNGLVNPNHIYVGQRLVIPAQQPTGKAHIVQRGETLTGIAWRYGLNPWTIARANGITNLNHIYVGQRLVIPGAAPPTEKPEQPTPAPSRSPSQPSTSPGPWSGEYFDNATLEGDPYTTRTDEKINFDWDYGPPAGGMPTNHFAVRWTGDFDFDEGTYRFYARVDDGVRLYVDDERVINGWRDGGLRLYTADRSLSAGEHAIRVEYYDSIQVARVHVWWKKISGPSPTATPDPTTTPAPTTGWHGEYFNNEDLAGDPVFTRDYPWIGFEWDTDAPEPGVEPDNFSARWTTKLHLKTDHYNFCAMSDDGARIWVEDELVLDHWHANNGVAYCGTYWAETGDYDVRVEYYEHGGDALIYVWWEPH